MKTETKEDFVMSELQKRWRKKTYRTEDGRDKGRNSEAVLTEGRQKRKKLKNEMILSFQETELLRSSNLASLCSLGEEKEKEIADSGERITIPKESR